MQKETKSPYLGMSQTIASLPSQTWTTYQSIGFHPVCPGDFFLRLRKRIVFTKTMAI